MHKKTFVIILTIALLCSFYVCFMIKGTSDLISTAYAEDQPETTVQEKETQETNTTPDMKDYDILKSCAVYENRMIRGVEYIWSDDHSACTAVGTADNQWSYTQLYYNANGLPTDMEKGKTYRIKCNTTSNNLYLSIGTFLDGKKIAADIQNFTHDDTYTVPINATGIFIRICVAEQAKVKDTISGLAIINTVSNESISAKIEDIYAEQQEIISDLEILKTNNTYDYLRDFAAYEDSHTYGVDFIWNEDKTECRATGTAEEPWAFNNLFYNDNGLPEGLEPGKTYKITCRTTNRDLFFVIGAFTDGETTNSKRAIFTQNGIYTVPENTTGMYIRVAVTPNITVNDTISGISVLSGVDEGIQSGDSASFYGKDFLKMYGEHADRFVNGITYHWENDSSCIINGISTGVASDYLYDGILPEGMTPGDEFIISFDTSYSYLGVENCFLDEMGNEIQRMRSPDASGFSFVVPANAYQWRFRLYLNKDRTAVNVRVNALKVVKLSPKAMDIPLIVSFIDDDTSNDDYVKKYHDACCHNGIKGTYAVVTKKIEDQNTSLDLLLSYEDEGFGMCAHCYLQGGAPEWQEFPRTDSSITQCRANLAKCLRQMREFGFTNFNYWVTPFGYRDHDLRDIAQGLGLECLISINNGRHNTNRDADRWFIRRVQLKHNDEKSYASMELVKQAIDNAVADGGGWLIITTHFNEGWKTLEWDNTLDENGYPIGYERFNEMVQYALGAGFVPMTVQQAWQYYAPILDANRNECNMGNAN